MGLTWTAPDEAAAWVKAVKESVGDAPFQGNFALAFAPTALAAALEAGLPIVTFSWGDPAPHLALCRAHRAHVGVQVANLAGARAMASIGIDFLVVQGVEAGGHVQSTTLLRDLLPSIAELGLPAIAAGGLANGGDVRRVLDLGASGAMLGTRFVATRESRAHEAYQAALLAGRETALTGLFDGGWPFAPHRVLRNETLEQWEAAGCSPPGRRPGEGETVGWAPGGAILRYEDTAPHRGFTGEVTSMCLYAGTGVDRIGDLPSAGELVRRLAGEAEIGAEAIGPRP